MKWRSTISLPAVALIAFFGVVVAWSLFLILDPIYVVYVHSNTQCVRIGIQGSRVTVARFPNTSGNPRIPAVTLYGLRPFSIYRDYSTYSEMFLNEIDAQFGNFWGWAPKPHSYAGFGYSFGTPLGIRVPTFNFVCIFPTWVFVAPFAIPLIFPARRMIRVRLRRRKNLCPHCAYDVRASTTRCPECGHHLVGSNRVLASAN